METQTHTKPLPCAFQDAAGRLEQWAQMEQMVATAPSESGSSATAPTVTEERRTSNVHGAPRRHSLQFRARPTEREDQPYGILGLRGVPYMLRAPTAASATDRGLRGPQESLADVAARCWWLSGRGS